MNNKLQVLMNIIWGFISSVLGYIISFLLTPILTDQLGIEAYGFISLANTFIVYIDIVVIALNGFAARFIAVEYHKGNIEGASKYYSSVLASNFVLMLIIDAISLPVIHFINYFILVPQDLLQDVKILFLIVLLNYNLNLFGIVFGTVAFVKNRIHVTSRNKSISSLIQVMIIILVIALLKPKVYLLAISNFFACIFLVIANYWYSRYIASDIKMSIRFVSGDKIKSLLASGVWTSVTHLGGALNTGLDLLITNKFLTNVLMGQISIGKQLANVMNGVSFLVANSFRPKQVECYGKGDDDGLIKNLSIALKIQCIVVTVIMSCFIAAGKTFFRIWIPNQDYDVIYMLSFIILGGEAMVCIIQPLSFVYTIINKLKLISIITVMSGAVNVIAMILLILNGLENGYVVVGTTAFINIILIWLHPCLVKKYLGLKDEFFFRIVVRHVIVFFVVTMIFFCLFRNIVFESLAVFLYTALSCLCFLHS